MSGPGAVRLVVLRLFWGGLAGKVLGLLREVLLAAAYGTGAPADAARVAQTATLSPANFFVADTLVAGFLPLHGALLREDPARAAVLFHAVRRVLGGLSLVLAAALLLLAPQAVALLAPGLAPRTAATAAAFLQVMALGVPSYVHFALLSYLEASHGSYRLSSVRPTGQNVGTVGGLLLAWWLSSPVLLAWGFTAGYLVLHAWAAASLRRRGLVPAPPPGPARAEVRELLGLLWVRVRPLVLLPVVLHGSVVVERRIGSAMGPGVVAAVDYARFVADTGVALVAVPLGFAGLAVLGVGAEADARARLERLLPAVLVVVVPVSVLLAARSTDVVELLYGHGAFGAAAVATAGPVLAGFAVGFWAQVVAYVLVKALNARDRNGAAARALVAGLAAGVALTAALHDALGPVVLGLAGSLSALVTAVVA
ncbi:lipid II flippase MurJ, partial [Kineococcus glutinatus]|uniref:lipid II flippase MurJ n=1 Tax=Kineococcus glutinatus TaxID=1070872 RepID=UPI0031F05ECD